jgi:hypothetical protein
LPAAQPVTRTSKEETMREGSQSIATGPVRSIRQLRERFERFRASKPIAAIVIEAAIGTPREAFTPAIDTAIVGRSGGRLLPVHAGLDSRLGGVLVFLHASEETFDFSPLVKTADDAKDFVAEQLVELEILESSDLSRGSWFVDVARTLERHGMSGELPVSLAGLDREVQRWSPDGFFVPERTADAASGKAHPLAQLCANVEPHRYLLVDDVVEASIAVLDLVLERLESPPPPPPASSATDPAPESTATSTVSQAATNDQTARRKGEEGEKPLPQSGRRGRRKNRDGDSAPDRAAFWMERAPDLVPDGDALQESLAAMDPKPTPRGVYEAMKLHGLEITLESVRNNVPPCWPRLLDGSPKPIWSFKEYAVEVSVESFERNLRRYGETMRGREVALRAASKNWDPQPASETLGPPSGPSQSEKRTRTIVAAAERVEEELGRVQTAMQSQADATPAWERLRSVLVEKLRVDEDAADDLIGQRDEASIARIAGVVVQARKKAGDTGDLDPKGRPRLKWRGRDGQ